MSDAGGDHRANSVSQDHDLDRMIPLGESPKDPRGDSCPRCGLPLMDPAATSPICPKCMLADALAETRLSMKAPGSGPISASENSGEHDFSDRESNRYEKGPSIAQGGMGEVIEARDIPVGRRVAMKVIHDHSRDRPEVRARFVEEAQITGQLEHPSIVPMHDLSFDEDGQVFYTMKRVEGRTLGSVLKNLAEGDKETLREYPLSRLLTVFQKICDAIAFAHSRGVIHRDLKPDNIMVGDFGEVLVMDWGLAKVVGMEELEFSIEAAAKPEDSAHRTLEGSVMGSIGYMSPEQAAGDLDRVGFASDIYALGAILYHLLTLRSTIRAKSVMEGIAKTEAGEIEAPAEVESEIAHVPGGRIPASLAAVTMKALSKEQSERYASVPELQAEIGAYQDGFATVAEDANVWRHLKLFVRRHKVASAAALIIVVLIAASAVISSHLRQRAEVAEGTALHALAESEQSIEFLTRLIRNPTSQEGGGAQISYLDFVENAKRTLEESDQLSEESRLRIEQSLGSAYQFAGRFEEAYALFSSNRDNTERVLGPDHPLTLGALGRLSQACEATVRHEQALALRQERFERVRRIHGKSDSYTLGVLNDLARSLANVGRLEEGINRLEDLMDLQKRIDPDSEKIHDQRITLVDLLFRQQRQESMERALVLSEEIVAYRENRFGKDHPTVYYHRFKLLQIKNWLQSITNEDLIQEMEDLVSKVEKRWEQTPHPELFEYRQLLAGMYDRSGEKEKAVVVLEKDYELIRNHLGLSSRTAVGTITSLARRYKVTGKRDKAIEILEWMESEFSHWAERDHARMATDLGHLYLHTTNELNKAEAFYQRRIQLAKEHLGAKHRKTIDYRLELARIRLKQGRIEEAKSIIDQFEATAKQLPGFWFHNIRYLQGGIAAAEGDRDEAIRYLEDGLTLSRERLGDSAHHRTAGATIGQLFYLYIQVERFEDALALMEDRETHASGGAEIQAGIQRSKAQALFALGRNEEGAASAQAWFDWWNQHYSNEKPPPPQALFPAETIANHLFLSDYIEEARSVGEPALGAYRDVFGRTNDQTLRMSELQLRILQKDNADPEAASRLIEEVITDLNRERPDDTTLIEKWEARR